MRHRGWGNVGTLGSPMGERTGLKSCLPKWGIWEEGECVTLNSFQGAGVKKGDRRHLEGGLKTGQVPEGDKCSKGQWGRSRKKKRVVEVLKKGG